MQTHLNVVPILVCEGPNFTTNELSGLVNIHLDTTTATPYFLNTALFETKPGLRGSNLVYNKVNAS